MERSTVKVSTIYTKRSSWVSEQTLSPNEPKMEVQLPSLNTMLQGLMRASRLAWGHRQNVKAMKVNRS